VHWPTDVLGGWVLGAGWALLAWLFLQRPNVNRT
jgi:undecaprenyl-diphosphatase